MEENLLRKKYISLLKKACKDKRLFSYAVLFYDDLVEKFNGITYRREDFETLEVGGQILEQDVVKDCLNGKEEITIQEIFVYLFERNLKTIKFDKLRADIDGQNNFATKSLYINRTELARFYKPQRVYLDQPYYDPNLPKKEYEKRCREVEKRQRILDMQSDMRALDDAEEKLKAHHKHVLYHELAHILELQTFGDRQYVRNHFCSDEKFIRSKNKYISDNNAVVASQPNVADQNDQKKEDYFQNFISAGKTAISEIFNEEFACFIDDSLNINYSDRLTSVKENGRSEYYSTRKKLFGECAYNANYDFALFIKALLGDIDIKNVRFNSKEVIKIINSAEVDLNRVHEDVDKMFDLILSMSLPDNIKEHLIECKQKAGDLDFYQCICLCIGLTDCFNKAYENEIREISATLKKLTQKILVDAIKDNISREINDENVIKDEKFFRRINSILSNIDNFILFKYDDVILRQEVDADGRKEKYYKSNELYPTKKHFEVYPDEVHLKSFAEIIEKVEKLVQENPEQIENIDEIMTYFAEQQALDKKYKNLLEQHNNIIEKEEKRRLEHRLRLERQWLEDVKMATTGHQSEEENEWF